MTNDTRVTAEEDSGLTMWRCQLNGLEDVHAFLREHGPGSAAPLPVLPWRFDKSGTFFAEIEGGYTLDHETMQKVPAHTVLAAYAVAIGAAVEDEAADDGKRNLVVFGRVGPGLPDLGLPGRTAIVLNAQVDADDPRPAEA